jgi:hypothetical protein
MYAADVMYGAVVPVVMTLMPSPTRLMQLLATTFIAHAVGSMVWLFTRPLVAEQWQFLVGVVWYERLLAACAMYVMIAVVECVYVHASSIQEKVYSYVRMMMV